MHTQNTHCLCTPVLPANSTDKENESLRDFKEYEGTQCYICKSEVKGECTGRKAHCTRGINDLKEMVPVYGCFKGTMGNPISHSIYRVYLMP